MIKLYIYYHPIDTIILPGPIIVEVVLISNKDQVIVNFVILLVKIYLHVTSTAEQS